MKTVFLVLFLCFVTNAFSYSVICNGSSKSGLFFTPSDDGVEGCFVVEWCTPADKNVTDWALDLKYKTPWAHDNCNEKFMVGDAIHSSFQEHIHLNLNCTNVCFKAKLDMIFNATCYHIDTRQISKRQSGITVISKTLNRNEIYIYIQNETIPPKEHFTSSKALANPTKIDGDNVELTWHLGYVPASEYEVALYPEQSDGKNDSILMKCTSHQVRTEVMCSAQAPSGYCVTTFQHQAPWVSGNFANNIIYLHHNFCNARDSLSPSVVFSTAARWEVWWALGGVGVALGLALLALLVLTAHRARLAGKLRHTVLLEWPARLASGASAANSMSPQPSPGVIVVLYFRECAALRRAGELLCALLAAAGCEAVDLYSAQSVAAAAPAGGAWLRALLLRGDARVLLLQSPAAALHAARLAADEDAAPQLQAPLLAGRAAWRQPHPADALLTLALRLLADGSLQDALPYKKYYVASVAGVQHGDVVPALTPQRRYLLPAAAEVLLKDLGVEALGEEAARLLQQFSEALDEYRRYALAEPGYLANNLMFD